MKFVLFLIITNLLLLPNFGNGAKILSIFPYPGPSQYMFIFPLLKALAEGGHEVTSISTFPQTEKLKNFRDIPIMANAHIYEDFLSETVEMKHKWLFEELLYASRFSENIIKNILEDSEVKKLMHSEHFDLIIVEILMTESLLGLGEYFNAPTVGVSTFGTISFVDYLVGNPIPLSYIPHMDLPYHNPLSAWQRMSNVIMEIVDNMLVNYLMLPRQQTLYEKYFPNATMSLNEARKNVSLVLLNDHFTLRQPRPYVPNMIEVGGLHIKQTPDPLEQELQDYLDNASEGVIYFSMGSNVQSKDLPKEKLNIFLDTFRKLKMKVLWKFETENLPNKPDNVLVRKWFDQPAILAHPNVKLFISHGGFLSTAETIFYAKPILGIPCMVDQFMNVRYAVKAGYALSLRLEEISKESFKATILELWHNPRYTQTVRRISQRFRDQPLTPLQTAIYWVEYVLRHEGAVHMRNAGQDLTFIQYHNIDVYIILSLIFIIIYQEKLKYVRYSEYLFY
ncbi:UDP-glycosyltransferase UGT5-like [Musca autumnalis]|uniref:UDP-glycosyltransferase UGT5-like n=1 Tax=Musca autumnalis TaxID=221902 RepID=UPI003CFAC658